MHLGGLRRRLSIACLYTLILVMGCASASGPANPRPGVYRFKDSEFEWVEVARGDGYTILRGPWFDADRFQRRMDEMLVALRDMNYPVERDRALIEQTNREVLGMELHMQEDIRTGNASYLALGFLMDDDLVLRFLGPGALVVRLQADSTVTSEPDRGILLCPKLEHGEYLDTRRRPVSYARTFDGHPDYASRPNLIFVRLKPEASDSRVTGLTLNMQKLRISRRQ